MFGTLQIKIIIAVIIAVIAGGGWFYVKSLQAENQALEMEKLQLTSKLEEQNRAILTFKEDADKRLAAAMVDIEKSKKETEDAKRRAQNAFRAKPSTPGDACKSALDLVNGVSK